MANDCLEGVSVVWWFMLIFTFFSCLCIFSFKLLLWLLELQFKRRKFGTLQNMAWKTFLLFGYSCLPYMCIKMALMVLFFTFLVNVGFQVGKKHLEHGKPCFGRCFCCLVIHLNLHACPVCASKSYHRVFVSFLMWLEHGNTWFGRRSCCFVIYALCQSSQVSMYSNGSGGTVIPEVTDPCMIHHMCLGLSCWSWSLAQETWGVVSLVPRVQNSARMVCSYLCCVLWAQ